MLDLVSAHITDMLSEIEIFTGISALDRRLSRNYAQDIINRLFPPAAGDPVNTFTLTLSSLSKISGSNFFKSFLQNRVESPRIFPLGEFAI